MEGRREIWDELEKLRYNDEFIAVYDAEIVQKKLENSARKEGKSVCKKAGIKQEKQSIASSMLKDNVPYSTISKYTRLSKQEILSLQ